jgi:hypothetical protein
MPSRLSRRSISCGALAIAGAVVMSIAPAPTAVAGARPAVRARASRVPCRPSPGTSTIAHSAKARIFSDARTGADYACLYGNGHPRRLSSAEHWEYRMARFAGPYVAFVAFAEASNTGIGVVDLRTGAKRTFHEDEEVAAVEPPESECPPADPHCRVVCPQVDSLVLEPDGSIAWIGVDFPAATPTGGAPCGTGIEQTIEVRRYDREGLGVIGSGDGIVPRSLRLSGSTLSWIDEGREATATLG